MIHIDRSRRNEAWNRVAEQGKAHMAKGNWVIMFPEGTRIPRGEQGQYKNGGTRLACTTGASVLPIAVNSARCWPRKSFVLRPGLIDISIGPTIPSAGRQPDELMREVEAWDRGRDAAHRPAGLHAGRADTGGQVKALSGVSRARGPGHRKLERHAPQSSRRPTQRSAPAVAVR